MDDTSNAGDAVMLRLCLANTKGGVGKTTTAAFLAWHASQAGERVLMVDTDPQESLTDWHNVSDEIGESWDFADLVQLPGGYSPGTDATDYTSGDYTVIVTDCPPSADATTLRSALQASDLLIIPTRPSMLELRRVEPTFDIADECDTPAVALVTQVRSGTRSSETIIDLVEAEGRRCLQTVVPMMESITTNAGPPFHVDAYATIWADIVAAIR